MAEKKWIQAVGMASTALPSMEIDPDDPVGMMQQVVDEITELRATLASRDAAIAKLLPSLMETRDAAAMLCRFIAEHVSVEFADRVPDDYDGFGKRADDAIRAAAEAARAEESARGPKGNA